MRKSLWITLAVVVCAAVAVGVAVGANGGRNDKTFEYAVGLWGDVPYSAAQEAVRPNLLADMNNQDLAFTVNDGDLKQATRSPCDDALYARALGWLNTLDRPAAFTPGDNDWTDCDRTSNGGFNAVERLDHERAVFFATNQTLGK